MLSSSLPSVGSGALKNREDPKVLGTSKVGIEYSPVTHEVNMLYFPQESALLQAASPFYKTFAIECSRAQVSVDMFLFSSAYQDVATLGELFSHVVVRATY